MNYQQQGIRQRQTVEELYREAQESRKKNQEDLFFESLDSKDIWDDDDADCFCE